MERIESKTATTCKERTKFIRITELIEKIEFTKRVSLKKRMSFKKSAAVLVLCAGLCSSCGSAANQVEPVMGTTAAIQNPTESTTSLDVTQPAQGAGESETSVQEAPKTMQEIYDAIVEMEKQPEMVILNDNYIANYYGIDLSLLEDYLFASAEDVIYADTIVMMKVKEESSADAMKEVLDTMVSQKKLELENYLPEQFQIVEKSEVVVSGQYVYLVISEKAKEIQDVIVQYLN